MCEWIFCKDVQVRISKSTQSVQFLLHIQFSSIHLTDNYKKYTIMAVNAFVHHHHYHLVTWKDQISTQSETVLWFSNFDIMRLNWGFHD